MMDQIQLDEDSRLLCAYCKSYETHHYKVEIFWRDKEDAETGQHIMTRWDDIQDPETGKYIFRKQGKLSITKDMAGNPSSRRDGLRIVLWCEHCDKLTAIELSQHKGQTFLEEGEYHETDPMD